MENRYSVKMSGQESEYYEAISEGCGEFAEDIFDVLTEDDYLYYAMGDYSDISTEEFAAILRKKNMIPVRDAKEFGIYGLENFHNIVRSFAKFIETADAKKFAPYSLTTKDDRFVYFYNGELVLSKEFLGPSYVGEDVEFGSPVVKFFEWLNQNYETAPSELVEKNLNTFIEMVKERPTHDTVDSCILLDDFDELFVTVNHEHKVPRNFKDIFFKSDLLKEFGKKIGAI